MELTPITFRHCSKNPAVIFPPAHLIPQVAFVLVNTDLAKSLDKLRICNAAPRHFASNDGPMPQAALETGIGRLELSVNAAICSPST